MAADPQFVGDAQIGTAFFDNAAGTTRKTLVTGATLGTSVAAISITQDDTSANEVELSIQPGGTGIEFVLGRVDVVDRAGHLSGRPATQLLDPVAMPWLEIDQNGNRFLVLKDGDLLKVKPVTAVNAPNQMLIVALGRDF